MGPAIEISGGSVANTMVGHRLVRRQGGVHRQGRRRPVRRRCSRTTSAPPAWPSDAPAAQGSDADRRARLILVTPDGQRTMNTFLGVSPQLGARRGRRRTDRARRASSIWKATCSIRPRPRRHSAQAADIAAKAGRQGGAHACPIRSASTGTAAEFLELIRTASTSCSPTRRRSPRSTRRRRSRGGAGARRRHQARRAHPLARRAASSWATASVAIAAAPVAKVVDTTGAGDLYAAGFLLGVARGKLDLETAGRLGSLAAAEIISHIGARPEVSLAELAAQAGC